MLKEHNMDPEDITFSPENLAKLIDLADAGTINSNVAKEVFEQIFQRISIRKICRRNGLKTVNDEGACTGDIGKSSRESSVSRRLPQWKEKAIGFW